MSFSLFTTLTAGLAAFVPLASAYTTPVGASPSGNPIYEPGLNSIVPVGKAYTITWNPTTDGNVSLVLLKGPSTNAVPFRTIANSTKNSGSYSWTPSNDLVPGTTGYGIELIVVGTGQYQYSTQFGISNPSYSNSTSTTSAAVVVDATNATSTTASAVYITEVVKSFTTYCPYATSLVLNNKTYTVSKATTLTITNCPCTITRESRIGAVVAATGVPSSGYLPANGTYAKPTGNMTVPSSLKTATSTKLSSATVNAAATTSGRSSGSASASASATHTGAAAHFGASMGGLVIAAGVMVLAL